MGIAVDREAVEYEKEKLEALGGSNAAVAKTVKETEDKLQAQINKLKVIRKDKGCATAGANLKKASDFEVYKRADEGKLSIARTVQRAKEDKLVDGSGATCDELEKIIAMDKKAVQFEKDKLDAQGRATRLTRPRRRWSPRPRRPSRSSSRSSPNSRRPRAASRRATLLRSPNAE